MTANGAHDRRLSQVLAQETEALTALVAGRPAPPVVLLAQARRTFAIAGLLSIAQAEHAVPARDTCILGTGYAEAACAVLDPVIGPELLAAHRADLRRGEARELLLHAEFDLTFIARIGEPVIDDGMLTLTAALSDLLAGMAANERVIPEQRQAARTAGDHAHQLAALYSGGDAGSW